MISSGAVPDQNELKRRAADRAVGLVQSGMIVGLGHGTTAAFAVTRLAELLRQGTLTKIIGVPCSNQTESEARQAGIPIGMLEDYPEIDLTIDGADEVDPSLNMIKGGGGALTREKVVAQASRRRVYIVDQTKLSPCLGTLRSVPVEAIRFAWKPVFLYLESLKAQPALRRKQDGTPYLTDQGNVLFDCNTGPIRRPEELDAALKSRAGIVEHGLFLALATDVIVAAPEGIKHLTP
jgi:ribose 5-phosphate isomerase A